MGSFWPDSSQPGYRRTRQAGSRIEPATGQDRTMSSQIGRLPPAYCAALLLATASVYLPAIAQGTAEKPTPKVGDRWEFQQSVKSVPGGDASQPWSRTVAEILPDRITMVGSNNQSFPLDASLNPIDPKGAEYSVMTYKFPMSVGSEWKYTARAGPNGQLERNGTYKVAAFEPVTVPAGTFECFRVDGEWQTTGRVYSGRGSEKYWYCPKLNYIAKRTSEFSAVTRDSGSTSEARISELSKFTPAK
jgi:hypothetical protein